MQLMTKQVEELIASNRKNSVLQENWAVVRYFCPLNGWSLYPMNYYPETESFYGFMYFRRRLYGHFDLADLEAMNEFFQYPIIQRDMFFRTKNLGDALRSDKLLRSQISASNVKVTANMRSTLRLVCEKLIVIQQGDPETKYRGLLEVFKMIKEK